MEKSPSIPPFSKREAYRCPDLLISYFESNQLFDILIKRCLAGGGFKAQYPFLKFFTVTFGFFFFHFGFALFSFLNIELLSKNFQLI